MPIVRKNHVITIIITYRPNFDKIIYFLSTIMLQHRPTYRYRCFNPSDAYRSATGVIFALCNYVFVIY